MVEPGAGSIEVDLRRLGLPLKCLLAGAMATALYVWPVLMVVYILSGGFRSIVFWSVMVGGLVLASPACWAITVAERRYWLRNSESLGEWVDPAPWK